MKNLFQKFMHSALNPGEFSIISHFLKDKKNETDVYDLMKPFWDTEIKVDTEFSAPESALKNKLMQSILNHEKKTTDRKLEIYKLGLGIAAIVILGLIINSLFLFKEGIQSEGELQSINTPPGAKTHLTLPDGTTVWLNSGSTLFFNSKFGKERLVRLKGEAFFDVTKSNKHFIVVTDYGQVEVTGTEFDVKSYQHENFQTTLIKGSVKVKTKDLNQEVILKPGEQAGIFGTELRVKQVDTDLFSSWKEGKLIFKNEYLPVVAKSLERWYNVKIELAKDKRLSKISYTGTLEMESFSEVLQLLKVTAPIDYSYDEKSRIINIQYKVQSKKNKVESNE